MQNQLSHLKVKVDTCSRNLFQVPIYVIPVKFQMIARAALTLKDTFALRFASIQSVLDSVEFLKNSEVILAKFSSSCVYMLSFS